MIFLYMCLQPHFTFCSTLRFAILHFASPLYILQHFTFCHFTFCNPTLHFAALYVLWSNNLNSATEIESAYHPVGKEKVAE